ncbi:hypothetical protein AB0K93_09170 [Streptomyces sp. NPDC052676]|uniref:hypothetical protein n=1 Tax=Streptomyces sp. NPDC052676 TaxID=3154953 RepID=UPI00342D6AA3
MASDGYQLKKSGMSGQAKELDGAGDDTGKIREAIAPTACYTSDALGGTDAAAAVNRYIAAWEAEARTLKSALHELAGKVRSAKGAYGGSDGLVRTAARNVTVADGALTTMPAPAVGTLTTLPAPADGTLTTLPAPAGRPSALAGY